MPLIFIVIFCVTTLCAHGLPGIGPDILKGSEYAPRYNNTVPGKIILCYIYLY